MSPLSARRCSKLIVSTALLLLPGCGPIDDQRITNLQDSAIVNPVPTERDFVGQNARHRVLLAVIDTGVDYNQPFLLENMHFALDASNRPVRLGHDYIGEDAWPAPYVARTSRYDPDIEDTKRFESQANFFRADRFVKLYPDLARFFHPSRNVPQEAGAVVSHGTHVAGLMVYDRPDIGLLAYRVLPINREPAPRTPADDLNVSAAVHHAAMLRAAVDEAVADGARVINLSLGAESDSRSPEEHARMSVYRLEFTLAVARHPDVLFVAAAGNSSLMLDEVDHLTYPCGVRAPNVLCVGALNKNGDPTEFSNIPMSGLDAVFVLGEDVLSTVPVNFCDVEDIGTPEAENVSDDDLARFAATARDKCGSSNFLKRLSGTSMASPLVARLAGEILIERPDLDAAGVIQEIYRRSTPGDINGHAIRKLRAPLPSWYLLEQAPPSARPPLQSAASAPGYWDAYLPPGRPD